MELKCKPDFDATLKRFEAWWDRQIIDRPPVSIRTTSDRPVPWPEKQHATLRDRWLDAEFSVDIMEAEAEGGVFLGDSYPRYEPCLGPELTATLFGCELEFTPGTSFSIPIAKSCRAILDMKPDLDTFYWNNIRRKTDLAIERGRGKWITGLPDLHTNGDLVAALRDPEGMCLDLADDPASVRAACDHVNERFTTIFDDLYQRLARAGLPCTSWVPALTMGRAYPVSCDFICMISPKMFQDAILPSLYDEIRWLDRSIYHLDGPGALRHLDALLDLPELDGIQWVYGAGNEPARKWIDVYKRIQAAGKSIQLLGTDIADTVAVCEHLRPEGVWLCPGGTYSRAETEEFLAWAGKWAAGKR